MSIKTTFFQLFSSPVYVLSIVSIILITGNFIELVNTTGDLSNYHCYAEGFWHGPKNILKNPHIFMYCQQSLIYFPALPFSLLPKEYPILSLIPFSLPLLFPIGWYQLLFGCMMIFSIIGFYLYLMHAVSRKSATLFLILILTGALRTAVSRFDLFPAMITFFCLAAAVKKKFFSAYILLVIAIFLKLYPAFLFFPLFIAEQQSFSKQTPLVKRLTNVFFFCFACCIFLSFSFLINPKHGFIVFDSYVHRPFEFESLGANTLQMLSFFKKASFCLNYSYGSINMYQTVSGKEKVCRSDVDNRKGANVFQIVFPLILFFGTLWTIKLQKEKKIPLPQSFISIILLLLITSKVFSPQYLIWLIPLIVYVQGYNGIWLGLWISISLLTMLLYPSLIYLYVIDLASLTHNVLWNYTYLFVLTLRNGLLIVLTVYHLFFMRNYLWKSAINP